jgi:O-antigen/teichoic acid export membrane protein
MKKIIENIFYQIVFQIILIILPIITVPVIAKSLGPSNLGIINYVSTICSYFRYLLDFGIGNYGVKEVALYRDCKKKLSRTFFSLVYFHIFFSIPSILLFFIIFEKSSIFFIMSFTLLSYTIDISWFFSGIEKFKAISICNALMRIIAFLLIIVFINDKNDFYTYAWILSLSSLFSSLSLWFFLKKRVYFVKPSFTEIFKHFFPMQEYFISMVLRNGYLTIPVLFMKKFSSYKSVGIYASGYSLINVIYVLILTIVTSTSPRIFNIAHKNRKEMILNITCILEALFFVVTFCYFCIVGVCDKFIIWFFDSRFEQLNIFFPTISLILFTMPIINVIHYHYLTAIDKVMCSNIIYLFNFILTVVVCFLLIPKYHFFGAMLSKVISDLFLLYLSYRYMKKHENILLPIKRLFLYLISGFIMFIIIKFIGRNLDSNILTTIIQVFVGGIFYFVISLIIKNSPTRLIFRYILNEKRL